MKTLLAALCLACAGACAAQTLQPRDIDGDGTVDAWYDPGRDLSWLADANAAAGSPFDNGSHGGDGRMTRNAALSWAAWLDVAGVTGWRLPSVVDLGSPGCDAAYAGTDCGYNVDTASSEMAHLFHAVLGNLSAYDATGQARPGVSGTDWGLVNAGPFVHAQNDAHWIGTPYPSPTVPMGWSFFTLSGRQVPFSHAAEMYAWAVHDGDVAAVPEPASAALLGLLGLGWLARRRTAGVWPLEAGAA
ncbi:MAG: hypothetical protein Fur0014_22900 [Rubrivivax sp.]